MSPARIDFDEVGASGEEPPKKVKGSEPGKRDKKVKIDLNDEPESLLDSLNTWRVKVVAGELLGILGFLAPQSSNYSIS